MHCISGHYVPHEPALIGSYARDFSSQPLTNNTLDDVEGMADEIDRPNVRREVSYIIFSPRYRGRLLADQAALLLLYR